jgi:hypothetical protein
LKIEVASLKKGLAGATEKLAKLEANVVAARPDPNDIKNGAVLASAGRTPQAPFALTHDEIQLIRDFIKVPLPLPGAPQNINVGDLLPDTALAPLPEPIMKMVPKLLGVRNSAIVVVRTSSSTRTETGT